MTGKASAKQKNTVSVNYRLHKEVVSELEKYCFVTGLTKTAAMESAIKLLTAPYHADEGYPKDGLCTKDMFHTGQYEIPCKILGKTEMYGKPYVRIVMQGSLLKVPADDVKEV